MLVYATDDVGRIDRVPVFFASLPVGHGGTFSAPDGGDWARVSARWLDWQLKGNADASLDFAGKDCRLCTDSRWTIVQKQLPLPAYEQVCKASHSFNLLDARRAISVTERQRFILRVRALARGCAEAYHAQREKLGFPGLRRSAEAA